MGKNRGLEGDKMGLMSKFKQIKMLRKKQKDNQQIYTSIYHTPMKFLFVVDYQMDYIYTTFFIDFECIE